MELFTLMLYAAAASLSLAASQQCTALTRDLDECPATTWPEEYACTAHQNSMWALFNCVRLDQSDTSNVDTRVCRNPYETTTSGEDDYDEWYLPDTYQGICMTPRLVLINRSQNQCSHCGMTGALQACPEDDPQFLNCLCEQNAKDKHFKCLAECFMPDSSISLTRVCESLVDHDDDFTRRSEPKFNSPRIDDNHNQLGERQQDDSRFPTQTIRSSYWLYSETLPALSVQWVTSLAAGDALVSCTVDSMINSQSCTTIPCRSTSCSETATQQPTMLVYNAVSTTAEPQSDTLALPTATSPPSPSTSTSHSTSINPKHNMQTVVVSTSFCLMFLFLRLV